MKWIEIKLNPLSTKDLANIAKPGDLLIYSSEDGNGIFLITEPAKKSNNIGSHIRFNNCIAHREYRKQRDSISEVDIFQFHLQQFKLYRRKSEFS